MKKAKVVCWCVVVLVLCGYMDSSAAGKHALLIGIQEYGGEDDPFLPSLNGPLNDIRIVGHILRDQFGMVSDDIILLLDEDATHSGIEAAFQQLIEQVRPGDFVYIHYSGHGSQAPDTNGDELSGKDQTWVTYGARQGIYDGKDDYDVRDDELNTWLSALYAKTEQVVFVSDSCHSATVSRGSAVKIRAVKGDTRPNPFPPSQGGNMFHPTAFAGVRIGAAQDNESAIEVQTESDTVYGVFTWYWVQALQQAKAGESWHDVFKRASIQLSVTRGNVQHPQIWGAGRGLQIGGGFVPMAITIPVKEVQAHRVTIGAGSLSGVTVDSVYRLHDPRHPEPQTLPTLTITETEPFLSYGVSNGTFPPHDSVVEESHAYHFRPIQVFLQADAPKGEDQRLLHTIRAAFEPSSRNRWRFSAYTLTEDPQRADLHLYLLRPKVENNQYVVAPEHDLLPLSFPGHSPEVWVLSLEHRVLYDFRIPFADHQQGFQNLQEALNSIARIKELKALTSPRGNTLSVEVEVTPVAYCQDGPECVIWQNHPDVPGLRPTGQPVSWTALQEQPVVRDAKYSFRLHNTSPTIDYYCYLIDITPQGKVFSIFPDSEEPEQYAMITAGETRYLIKEVVFELPAPGEETLKLIITREPIDIGLLEVTGFQKRAGRQGTYNPLERVLLNASYGLRGRQHIPHNTWATEQVSFDVQ